MVPGELAPTIETVARLKDFAPDYLVVALGVDSYRHDPSGKLHLEREDYSRIGQAVAALAAPKMFIFEGGYDHLAIGDCVTCVLEPTAGH